MFSLWYISSIRDEIKGVGGEFVAACPIRYSWLDLREESRLRWAVFRNPAKDLPHVPRQRRRSVQVSLRGNERSGGRRGGWNAD